MKIAQDKVDSSTGFFEVRRKVGPLLKTYIFIFQIYLIQLHQGFLFGIIGFQEHFTKKGLDIPEEFYGGEVLDLASMGVTHIGDTF